MKIKFNEFINENRNWYDIDPKLKLLKSYIHIIDNADGDYDLQRQYFIVLHNYLIIERMMYDIVKLAGKEINKYLHLEKLNSIDEVNAKFLELYDVHSPVRNNVETIDNIDEFKDYLIKHSNIDKKLMKK